MKLHENKYLRKMFIAQVHLQLNVMFQFIKLSVLLGNAIFSTEQEICHERNWD